MTNTPPEDELELIYDPLVNPESFEPKPDDESPFQEDFDENDS